MVDSLLTSFCLAFIFLGEINPCSNSGTENFERKMAASKWAL